MIRQQIPAVQQSPAYSSHVVLNNVNNNNTNTNNIAGSNYDAPHASGQQVSGPPFISSAISTQQVPALAHFARPSPQPTHARSQAQQSDPHTMATPPLPQTPTNTIQPPAAGSTLPAPSPKSPQSPGSQNREQQRIELLFSINVELLQEVNRLQAEGHGGAISPQQLMQLRNEGKPDKMASDEYIQCLRRVQANLSYLMPKAQSDPSNQAKAPPGPAHMTPPPHMAQLQPKYDQLRDLFPGWQGMDNRAAASSASPRPNGPNASNGMTAPAASAQA